MQPVLCLERGQGISVECEGVLVCSTSNITELLQSRPRVLADVQVQRIAHDVAVRALPSAARQSVSSAPPGRGVAYLLGAAAALAVVLLLVAEPNGAAARDLVRWVAERVEDLG